MIVSVKHEGGDSMYHFEKYLMRHENRITKDFSGEILVIERRWDGTILGSCPASEPLKELDSYECRPDNNVWIQEQSGKLILV